MERLKSWVMASTALSAAEVVVAIRSRIASKSAGQLSFVAFLVLLLTAGNAMQIIGINFWLQTFPSQYSGPYTTLTISSIVYVLFFLMLTIPYIIVKRPCLRFTLSMHGFVLLVIIGLFDALNSFMSIYATPDTPEVLQALFTSLQPIYTCLITKLLLHDIRTYCNPYVLAAFFLMILGVFVASISDFSEGSSESGTKKWWSLIFFLSVPLTSVYNVLQTKYMEDFTKVHELEEIQHVHDHDPLLNDAESLTRMSSDYGTPVRKRPIQQAETAVEHHQGEDTIVKLFMLCGDTFFQVVTCFLLLPADALPWYGSSPTVPDAWTSFSEGVKCIFTCHWNFIYCAIYSFGFIFTYIGSAYLNHYSATLCSMIGQLSSPVTALLLVIIPKWNVNQGSTPWYLSVVAIVLLTIGTLFYSFWEEMGELMEEKNQEDDAERVV